MYGVKKLRELILELAVRGKLVPQNPSDEPASVLLERIAAEKAQLVKDKVIPRSKVLPELLDSDIPIDLPTGWSIVRLGNLTSKLGSGSTPRGGKAAYVEEGVPFLRSQNIRNEGIKLDDIAYIPMETHQKMEKTKVLPNDVLLNITGASLGRSTIFPESLYEANVSQHVTIIRLIESKMSSFIHLGILSPMVQKLVWGRQVGMAIEGLSKKVLEMFEFPVPPLEEQHRIVAKVDELMTLCDQLEQQTEASIEAHQVLVITVLDTLTNSTDAEELMQNWARISEHFDTLFTTEASIDQLKQTILQLAVMGKLVPQDPNDEPAAKLLERIAEEKAQLIKDKKIKKQKALPPITDDEKPFELPRGWEWCRFGDVAISRLGKMLDKSKNLGNPLPYLRNTNVQWHRFDLEDIKLMKIEDAEKEEFLVLPGDLLICEGGEPGRCAIWKDDSTEMYFQKALHRARTLGGCLPQYLQLCLTVDAANGSLEKYFTGATIKHFVGAKLNLYSHPLPPLEEQLRIICKVDCLINTCVQLKQRLRDSQQTQLQLTDAIVEQAL
ncbi:restriction endonuclease subunit S [Vibrio neptunius]